MQIKLKRHETQHETRETQHETHEVKKHSFRIWDFLISLSIFLIFFGTPLFFTGMTLQGIGFDKQIFFYGALLIGLVAWIFKGISSGEISIRRTPLDIPIVLFLVASLLSMVFSVNRWDSFLGGFSIPSKGFLAVLSMAAFYWFFMSNINEKRLKLAFRSLVWAVGILAVFMTLKFTGLAGYIISMTGITVPESLQFLMEKSFNTIGLLGNLGVFFGAGLLLILNFKFTILNKISNIKYQKDDGTADGDGRGTVLRAPTDGRGWIAKIFKLGLILLLIYLTFALLNYTGMIILLIAFALYIIFTISKVVPASRLAKGVAIFMFATILLSMIVGSAFQFVSVDLPTEVGLSKQAAWSVSSEAIKENWVVGTGLATFKYGFSKYRPKGLNNSILWQTKFSGAGLFAELPATVGLVGSLTFVLLLLAYVGLIVTTQINTNIKQIDTDTAADGDGRGTVPRAPTTEGFLLSLFCASILIILYMLLSLSSTAVILYGIMIVTLTVATAAQARPDMFKEYKFSYHTSPQYALALSFAFMCIASGVIVIFALLGKIFIADVYAKKATNAETFDQAAVLMEQAAGLVTFQDEYLSRLGNIYLANGITEIQKSEADKDKARDLFVSSLNAHRQAVILAVNDPDRWEAYAVAAETMSNYDPTMLDEAIGVYEKAVELNPLNPLLYTRLARMQVTRGDYIKTEKDQEMPIEKADLYNSAKDNYKKAIALRGDVADFYSSLALTQERMNEIDKAMENFQKALILKPEDPTFLYQLGRLFENSGSVEMGKQYYRKVLDILEAIAIPESGVDVNAETKEALRGLIDADSNADANADNDAVLNYDVSPQADQPAG